MNCLICGNVIYTWSEYIALCNGCYTTFCADWNENYRDKQGFKSFCKNFTDSCMKDNEIKAVSNKQMSKKEVQLSQFLV